MGIARRLPQLAFALTATNMLPGAIIAVSLLAYSPLFVSVFAIPKLIVLSLGAGALCLALALKGKIRGVGLVGMLALGYYLLSAVFADDKYLAIVGNYNDYSLGLLGVFIALTFFLYPDVDKDKTIEILSLAGVGIGLIALYQWGLIPSMTLNGRAIGTIGSPVSLGVLLAILLPIAFSRSKIYAIAILLGIIASGSRGAILAGVAGTMVYRWRK